MEIREDKTYRAYLVQCWKEGPTAWRFAAQQIGEETRRRGFGDLEALLDFLREAFASERARANERNGEEADVHGEVE